MAEAEARAHEQAEQLAPPRKITNPTIALARAFVSAQHYANEPRYRQTAPAMPRAEGYEYVEVPLWAMRQLVDAVGAALSRAVMPCRICNGIEGCDHSVIERTRAYLAAIPSNES